MRQNQENPNSSQLTGNVKDKARSSRNRDSRKEDGRNGGLHSVNSKCRGEQTEPSWDDDEPLTVSRAHLYRLVTRRPHA
jgi:hypothetical protein